jgi:ADP-ribose pyrophosphatase YjhB (NUDIX family)
MSSADICWESGRGRFVYWVAGVCLERGHVFLCQLDGTDFWFLPGGRGQMTEPSAKTLAREMKEELATAVRVGRLLWIAENFFVEGDRSFHEIGLYYRMALPAVSGYRDTRLTFPRPAPRLLFHWFPVGGPARVRLFPAFLRGALRRLPRTPQHVVEQDDGGKSEPVP